MLKPLSIIKLDDQLLGGATSGTSEATSGAGEATSGAGEATPEVTANPDSTSTSVNPNQFKYTGADNATATFKDYLNEILSEGQKETGKNIFSEQNVIYQSLLDDIVPKLNETSKSEFLNYMKQLQALDKEMIQAIQNIMSVYGPRKKKSRDAMLGLKYQLYVLQVNALRQLLRKFNLDSAEFQKNLDDLLKIAEKKIALVNQILDKTDEEEATGAINDPKVIATVNKLLKKAELDQSVTDKIEEFLTGEQQRGGGTVNKTQAQYKMLLQQMDRLFSFFKTELIVKIVFFMNYTDQYSKIFSGTNKELGKYVITVQKNLFIDISNIDDILYSQLNRMYNSYLRDKGSDVSTSKTFNEMIDIHTKIYNTINSLSTQIGGATVVSGGTEVPVTAPGGTEVPVTAPRDASAPGGQQETSTTDASASGQVGVQPPISSTEDGQARNPNGKIFIPFFLALIKRLTDRFFTTYIGTIEPLFALMLKSFDEINRIYNPDNLLMEDFVKHINSEYKRILDENKIVYTYIKTRTDDDPKDRGANPRFIMQGMKSDYVSLEDNNMKLKYIEYKDKIDDFENTKDARKNWEEEIANKDPTDINEFEIGPFDGYFEAENNKTVSENVFKGIKTKITNGGTFVIIGYGQSGSGKTSTLIYFDKGEIGERDGIIMEIFKQKEIVENYDKLNLSMTNIYTGFPNNPFEPSSDRYQITPMKLDGDKTEMTFEYNKDKKAWLKGTESIGEVISKNFDDKSKREVEPTTNNPQSSRGHVVVSMKGIRKSSADASFKDFNMCVCDLAGFENKFKCEGSINDIKGMFNIYTDKTGKPKWDKYAKDIGFDEYKCKVKSDPKLNKITEDLQKLINDYNQAVGEKLPGEESLKIKDPIVQSQVDKCDSVYRGLSVKEKNQLDGTEQKYNEDTKKALKEFSLEFSTIHGYDLNNPSWRETLNNFKSIQGGEKIYEEFFNHIKKDNYKPFQDTLEKYWYEIMGKIQGITKSAGFTYESVDKEVKKFIETRDTVLKGNKKWYDDLDKLYQPIKSEFDLKIKSIEPVNIKNIIKDKVFGSLDSFIIFMMFYVNDDADSDTNLFNLKKVKVGSTFRGGFYQRFPYGYIMYQLYDVENENSNEFGKYDVDKPKNSFENSPTTKEVFDKTMTMIDNNLPVKQKGATTFDKLPKSGAEVRKPEFKSKSSSGSSDPKEIFINQRNRIYEQLTLSRLHYNCLLRVEEGYMINTSLLEMKDQIKNLIIEANNLTEEMIFWDTLYNPYCYNLNLMSDTVYEAPSSNTQAEAAIIIEQIKKMTNYTAGSGMRLNFIVFTVINKSFVTNNPPNPPYININRAKKLFDNNDIKGLAAELKRIILKYRVDPYYKNDDKLTSINPNDINEDDERVVKRFFKTILEIFDKNNSATLVGTIETTEILQKLNQRYLCTKTEKPVELINEYSSILELVTIRGDGNYKNKYMIKYE